MSFMRAGNLACSRVGRLVTYRNTRMLSATAFRAETSVKPSSSVADAPTTPLSESTLIQKETPAEAMTRHQPDYDATVDHGTSYEGPYTLRGF